jgi:Sulfotransferase domain
MGRIFRTLEYATRIVLGQVSAGRGATVYPDDVFLVSYPKSGNTWVRFLIANLVHTDEPVTFTNMESRLPSIYILPDRELRRIPRPRVLKSHECFHPRYQNVIYIVRDPRDVAVSYFHYNIKKRLLAHDASIEQYLPMFLNDELDMRVGSWSDHVLSWINMAETRNKFLLLRYEDMLVNAEGELARVAEFLNIPATSDRLKRAVELSSAGRMRNLEKQQAGEWVFTKGMRQDIPFIRSAKSGGWRASLPKPAVEEIENAWGPVMERMGYVLSKDMPPAPAETRNEVPSVS